jgi:hypothetical protein
LTPALKTITRSRKNKNAITEPDVDQLDAPAPKRKRNKQNVPTRVQAAANEGEELDKTSTFKNQLN